MTDENRELSFMEYMQSASKPGGEDSFSGEAIDSSDFIDDHIEEALDEEIAKSSEAVYSTQPDTQRDTYGDYQTAPYGYSSASQPEYSYVAPSYTGTGAEAVTGAGTGTGAGAVTENRIGDYVYTTEGSSSGVGLGAGLGAASAGVGNAAPKEPSQPYSFRESETAASNPAPKEPSQPYSFRESGTEKNYKKEKSGYVTKKGFFIALLCGMLATSGLTMGLLAATGAFDKNIVYEAPESSNTAVAPAEPVQEEEKESTSAPNHNLAEMTGSPLSVQEIISKNANAVVEIQTEAVKTDSWLQNYITQGAGSGVIISEDGYIMTCYHVIEDSRAITVKLKNGTEYAADIIGEDPLNDVAVLKVEASGLSFASYGDSESLSIGDLVVAIGNPLGELGGSASTGIISALDRDLTVDGKKMTLMQTDASINPGNSGGGLFDGYGNFIGLVVAKSSGSDIEGLGFAIPINTAASIANRLIENGVISGNALIGVNIVDLTNSADAMQYGVRLTGIYITGVSSDEAKAAGFEEGDLIYYVGDYEIDSQAALSSALAMYEPGDTVTVTVIRNNRTVEIETVLIERE